MFETLKKIYPFIQKNKVLFIFSLVLGIPIALLKGFQAFYIKEIFDFIFDGTQHANGLIEKCLILCFSQGLVVVFRVFHYGNLRNIVEDAACTIREKIYSSISLRPYREISKYKSGELVSIGIFDTNSFALSMNFASNIFREPISAIVLLGVAIYHDWKLTLFVFAIIPIVVLILSYTGKKIKKHTRRAQNIMGELTEQMNEIIFGIIPIKIYNVEEKFLEKYKNKNKEFLESRVKAISYEEHSKPSVELVGVCALIGIIIFAFLRIQAGELTTSEFMSFVAALALFLEPIKKINIANVGLNQARASADRIYSLLDLDIEDENSEDTHNLKFNKSIEFKNVCFSYNSEVVLKNFNLIIKKGSKVGLVGASGSGKSTVLSLLLRLYEVDSGEILIDDLEISKINKRELRSLFSYVDQKGFLIEDSLEENIRLGRRKNDHLKEIKQKMKLDFLDGSGEEMIKEGGRNFSGGQNQRISLVRALNKKAPIYIFDEATSALDNETERNISQSLNELLKNKTIISIAHRLNTIKDYDEIVLLKNGEIAERGSHKELVLKNGEYKKLYDLSIG